MHFRLFRVVVCSFYSADVSISSTDPQTLYQYFNTKWPEPIYSVRQQTLTPHLWREQRRVEQQTKVREDSTITEMVPPRAFFWLKVPN